MRPGPKGVKILEAELENERKLYAAAPPESEDREIHARNVVMLTRTLANKHEFLPQPGNYAAHLDAGGDPLVTTDMKMLGKQPGGGSSTPQFQFVTGAPPTNPSPTPVGTFQMISTARKLDAAPTPPPAGEAAPGVPEAGTGVGRQPVVGFAETPGGAATGLRTPRVGDTFGSLGLDDPVDKRKIGRIAVETAGSVLGGIVGGSRMGAPGAVLGEGVGAAGGSAVAETFDPTEKPVSTAVDTGLVSTAVAGTVAGGVGLLRKMIGEPTTAGKRLIQIAEKRGEVPLPGAVLPEGSLASKIEAIGKADIFTGQRIKEKIELMGQWNTQEVSQYVNDALRVKALADKGFKEWDKVAEKVYGNSRVVKLPVTTADSLEPIVKIYRERGLVHQLDPNLVSTVERIQRARETGMQITNINLTFAEAEAARKLLYENARARARLASTDTSSMGGGDDLAQAYRREAKVVGDAIDTTVDTSVKNGKIPADARSNLLGARDLWKQWKQGELLMDEILPAVKSAERGHRPLASTEIEAALKRIDKQEAAMGGKTLISGQQRGYLSAMERAMKAAEDAGKITQFSWMVRGGQATLLVGGGVGGAVAGPAAAGAALLIAGTPALFNYLVTNKTAAGLMLRGMRVEPGTKAAFDVTRQFTTLLAKDGWIAPPERVDGEDAGPQSSLLEKGLDLVVPSAIAADPTGKYKYELVSGMGSGTIGTFDDKKSLLEFARSHGIEIYTKPGQPWGAVKVRRIPIPGSK